MPVSAGVHDAPAASVVATHLLIGHRALPFTHAELPVTIVCHGPITLLRAGNGITLNHRAIQRDTTLEPGDRVGFPGGEASVIGVEH